MLECKGIHKSSKTKDNISKNVTGDEGGMYKRDTTRLPKQDFTEIARNSRE